MRQREPGETVDPDPVHLAGQGHGRLDRFELRDAHGAAVLAGAGPFHEVGEGLVKEEVVLEAAGPHELDQPPFKAFLLDVEDQGAVLVGPEPVFEGLAGNEGVVVDDEVLALAADINLDPILVWRGPEFGQGVTAVRDELHLDRFLFRSRLKSTVLRMNFFLAAQFTFQ